MEELYLCPDCRAEHAEPYEAVLGHHARCVACALVLEALIGEQMLELKVLAIRIAA
jgi:hypothetical protein